MHTGPKEIAIHRDLRVGGRHPFFLIGGPCVIESEEHALMLAEKIQHICAKENVPFIFKASYDKANRSSFQSFRGPGVQKGLTILSRIKKDLDLPVTSDVHETNQIEEAAEVLDIIQIPAFLCRQTDLLVAAAKTQKPINIKKGQFLSPLEMKNAIDKILSQGNTNIMLTERGSSFGYNNLVFDVRSIPIMKEWGFPVLIDASHSVQRPGEEGTSSGGEARFIPTIAKAATSAGADGLFLEIHNDPAHALSDKYNLLNINKLAALLQALQRLKKAITPENALQ